MQLAFLILIWLNVPPVWWIRCTCRPDSNSRTQEIWQDAIESFFSHALGRQEKFGPIQAFRFKGYLDREGKVIEGLYPQSEAEHNGEATDWSSKRFQEERQGQRIHMWCTYVFCKGDYQVGSGSEPEIQIWPDVTPKDWQDVQNK